MHRVPAAVHRFLDLDADVDKDEGEEEDEEEEEQALQGSFFFLLYV